MGTSQNHRPTRMAGLGLLVLVLLVVWTGCRPSIPGAAPGGGGGGAVAEATVWAHYFPPYPISIDDAPAESDYYTRNYLDPAGERGKHAAYGGLLRDRPLPRPPRGEDFRLQDLRTEVEQAKSAGIDGFILNVMTLDGSNWRAGVDLMQAATDVGGFQVAVSVDATASIGRADPSVVAERLAELYRSPAAARTGSAFRLDSFAAERRPTSWWQKLISHLRRDHDVPVALTAVFLDPNDANLRAFAPFSRGFGSWGARTVAGNAASRRDAARAHRLDRTWMAAVAAQDARPRSGRFAEAGNTATLRASWGAAIEAGADEVQLVTWNDYSESTHLAPSLAHGTAFLEISRYYAEWFETRREPSITSELLVLSHRVHPAAAAPPPGQLAMAPDLAGPVPVRDQVEALVMLRQPAQVEVRTTTGATMFTAPAGVSAFTVPLVAGDVSARVIRGGATVVEAASPVPVTTSPWRLDLQYYAVSSSEP